MLLFLFCEQGNWGWGRLGCEKKAMEALRMELHTLLMEQYFV